jgi:hypothetical protein
MPLRIVTSRDRIITDALPLTRIRAHAERHLLHNTVVISTEMLAFRTLNTSRSRQSQSDISAVTRNYAATFPHARHHCGQIAIDIADGTFFHY